MFWILRRTGAANFFNSINNNYSSKSSANNNNHTDKNATRPHRKEYGRLSVDDTDTITTNSSSSSNSSTSSGGNDDPHRLGQQPCVSDPFDGPHQSAATDNHYASTMIDSCSTANAPPQPNKSTTTTTPTAASATAHGMSTSASMMSTTSSRCTGFGSNGAGVGMMAAIDGLDSDAELDRIAAKDSRCFNEVTISRLQAMALSDDDDYDESLTCNVCDRAFHCHRQLASHQQKKRHFGCSGCDSLFPSLMLLEHHKEEFEHWSDMDDDDGHQQPACCRRARGGDYLTDTDSITSDAESEDLERLL